MLNHCERCKRSLERRDEETDSIIVEAGETQCCCGSIDDCNNYYDALCVDCCDSICNSSHIWEAKSAGGGYYIVNPSY